MARARPPSSAASAGSCHRSPARSPAPLTCASDTSHNTVASRSKLLDLLREFTQATPQPPRTHGFPLDLSVRSPVDLSIKRLAIVIISHDVEDLLHLCDEIARVHPADDPEHAARVEMISP